ncbi:iron-sulfur cluster repair di-iron protein [Niabella soli]|uniref:Iron-sulfur cluster repair di-iron protein n=1 Tax=Niabella soli DSM 19437 TaxID=929713 RepID=W0EWY7_9BACT|nr:iron-sulfur cluster repair di-iron protein [Niabella soli]AHF15282.1 iron-sulfur cluster repair di-iron protein [Niabella soli DSM 19437]
MNITPQTIIGALVAQDYRTAPVFKNYGIDFCCKGNRTIAEACEKKRIALDPLIDTLNNAAQTVSASTPDFNAWPPDLLADYIEKKHHRYISSRTPEIIPFLNKLARVHGDLHPELIELDQLFNESAWDLAAHLKNEEQILFPYIRKMVESGRATAPFGTVQHPIEVMLYEHNNEGERFRKMAALTNNYTPPEGACNTYKATFSLLKEFEEDLHLHIHLENNILFPKALLLEQSLCN